jgi:hypothetical protein
MLKEYIWFHLLHSIVGWRNISFWQILVFATVPVTYMTVFGHDMRKYYRI